MADQIIPFPRLDLANLPFPDALSGLWDMLQNEDGTPMSVEANALLIALHEQYTATENALRRSDAHVAGLIEATRELSFQRDNALDLARSFRDNGAKYLRRQLVGCLRIEFDLANDEEAEAVLRVFEGNEDRISTYLKSDLRDLVEQIVTDYHEREQD